MNNNNIFFNQSQFMRNYNETHRQEFNPEYFERSNEEIIEAIKKIAYSIEKDRYFTLKVLETRVIYDYEEIYNMLYDHEEKRRKKSSKYDNPYSFIDINDSDIMLLEIKYLVRHNGKERQEIDKEIVEVENPYEIMQVLIALPRFVRKYYFRLNGNYYTSTFQIVDGSTYNNSNLNSNQKKIDCITFKTMFMPVRVYKVGRDMMDYYTKSTVRNILYSSNIFNSSVDCMFYILANYGLYGAFDFLDIRCIRILDKPPVNDPNWFVFQRHNVYICYPKECAHDPMVQSLAATIYDGIEKDATADNLYNIRYWIRILGKHFRNDSIDKGLFVLDSIDGIYDIITHDELHLPEDCKGNIYQILRWIMREFNYLKQKDNVDVTIKRLRLSEYIAHVYATKVSKGIHRVSDMGKRVTLKSVIRAIYTSPMYVINNIITMSNLIAYRDLVNDNDATLALKYTYKGISGLGEDGSAVQPLYKYVDASHAGILDLDASTESDPGMSGIICPMSNLYNKNSFSQYQEPNYWAEKYKPYQNNFFHFDQMQNPISMPQNETPEYYNLRDNVIQESLEIDKIKCPIFNLNDPSISYSSITSDLEQQKKETNNTTGVLFTIRKDT